MLIQVQSFLNSANKLIISVSNSTTIDQLKALVNADEGVDTAIMEFYVNNVAAASTATMASLNVTEGSYVGSSNTISKLSTKQSRQIAKLELAQLRRQAAGDSSKPYYRNNRYYDITLLPTQYIGNDILDNPNIGGLVISRPWQSSPVGPGVINKLLLETGEYLLLEDGSYILLEN